MRDGLNRLDMVHYAGRLSTAWRVGLIATALAVLAGYAPQVFAQTPPPMTFTASVSSANGSLSTTLTWSAPWAQSCTASGHTLWTGQKAASGTLALPAITLSGTYPLTLACVGPATANTITLTWVAPTVNTDGSALAKCPSATSTGKCLAGFRVYRATNSRLEGAEMTPVNNPNALTWVTGALPAATHYFGLEAVNGDGVPSPMSPIASATVAASTARTETITLTVNPVPGSPTGVQARPTATPTP
jgi:hypothetical protein